MKQSNENAVDLLLRSLARADGESRAEEKFVGAAAAQHLDADELNLYAEGVLPATARVRYTEHLADCQRCRTLVVGLAQAAGATMQREQTSQQTGATFWQTLTTLILLPVLRYALPAVVLTGVLAIGLLALRDQRRTDMVAVNQQPDSTAPLNPPSEQTANPAPGNSPATVLSQQGADANAPSSVLKNNPEATPNVPPQTQPAKPGAITTDGISAKEVQELPVAAGGVQQPAYAPEPPPPPKVSSETDKKSEARKEGVFDTELAKRNEDESKLLSKDDSPTHGPSRSRAMSSVRRRDADSADEGRAASNAAKKSAAEEVETRTVSGRHFRLQGNAWIDTAYSASRGATSVGRGSEQFRALMADEPGLRAIVQQLGGEIVVVWKNKAYRIR
jgi:hypothetical protein